MVKNREYRLVILGLLLVGFFCGMLIGAESMSGESAEPSGESARRTPVEEMAGMLPEDVIGFLSSSGGDYLESGFDESILGRIWSEPSFGQFYQSVKGAIQAKINSKLTDPEGRQLYEDVKSLFKLSLSRPMLVGLAAKVGSDDEVPIYGFLIIEAGVKKLEMSELIGRVETADEDLGIADIKIGPYTMRGSLEGDVPYYWGWVNNYFVLAINDGEGRAVKKMTLPGRSEYQSKLEKVPGHGDALAVYVDLQAAAAVVKSEVRHGRATPTGPTLDGKWQRLDKIRARCVHRWRWLPMVR